MVIINGMESFRDEIFLGFRVFRRQDEFRINSFVDSGLDPVRFFPDIFLCGDPVLECSKAPTGAFFVLPIAAGGRGDSVLLYSLKKLFRVGVL